MLLGTLGGLRGPLLAATPYTFKPVQVHGGGYVDGIVFHPAQANLIYARTDMGGVYRWNNVTTAWIPLTDFLNRDQADYMGNLALALDPNNVNKVYVMAGKYTQSWAGNGALLTSSDQGATWSVTALPFKVGGNEDGRTMGERMAVDPNLGSILFAGSNSSALYKSTNSGASWAAVASFPSTNITFVVFDKASGSSGSATPTLYVGVNATTNNLYRSTDGGATWALVPGQPTGNLPMRAAWGAGGRLYITYANALGPNGVTAGAAWRLDGGSTWTNLNPPAGQGGWCGVGVFPGASDQVALATMDRWWPADEVYRSTNNGAAWTAKLTGATMDETSAPWVASGTPHWLSDVEIDPFNADRAFFVTGYGVYMTTNFSAATPTWAFASTGIEQTVPTQLISPPAGAPVLSAMGDVDGFKHDNPDLVPALRHQPEVGTTLGIAFAEAVPSKMVKAYNAGAPNNYGGYSTNSGANWTPFPSYPAGATGGGTRSIAISPNGTNIVWCPAGAPCSYSTNNGTSWTSCGGGMPQALEPVADRVNSSKFYMADWNTGQLWASTNGGVSFAVAATGLGVVPSYQAGDYSLKATLGIEGDLWLCTGGNGLWHSTNSGTSFTKSASFSNAYEVATGKAVAAGYPSLYVFGTTAGVRGFYRSDDTGATWTRINDDQHQYGWIHDFSGDPRIYGRLYLSAEGRGALYGDIPAGGTPTFTPTRTNTPTATRTVTATVTLTSTTSPAASTATFTGTPSRTVSPSATVTSTQTPAAPTATSTVTPSRTSTSTATPSATLTRTATGTPSSSATPSSSSTGTPSQTRTVTVTPSSTASPTQTRTISPSPSVTMTFTDVPVGSTLTDTPSITETVTVSPTASPTESSTPSETQTVTPTPSGTVTLSATPTSTGTPSSSVTPSGTSSSTETPGPSATSSATLTPTPTLTSTPSQTLPPSVTASVTPSSVSTGTPTITPSTPATGTRTVTATPTFSVTSVSLGTATDTPTPTVATTLSGNVPLEIIEFRPLPNPNPGCLAVHLSASADEVIVRLWTPAMSLVAESRLTQVPAGWSQVPLATEFLKNAPNGVYFSTVSAKGQGRQALPKAPGKLLVLR